MNLFFSGIDGMVQGGSPEKELLSHRISDKIGLIWIKKGFNQEMLFF